MGAFVDLFGLLMMGLVVRQVLGGMPAAGRARVAHLLIGVVFLYGCLGFFGQAAAATRGLAFLPGSLEWPVLWPETSARDSSDNSIVGLAPVGRIQVYDPQGQFLRGWFVDASGGSFKLQVTPSDQIEVFTAKRQRRFVFSPGGELLEQGTYAPASYGGVITRPSVARKVRAPWPLWPLASPFIAWALFACGMLGLALAEWRAKQGSRPTRS